MSTLIKVTLISSLHNVNFNKIYTKIKSFKLYKVPKPKIYHTGIFNFIEYIKYIYKIRWEEETAKLMELVSLT